MDINDFILKFSGLFEDGVGADVVPSTEFRTLEHWDSLALLGFLSMVGSEYQVRIAAAEIRGAKTIQDLYDLVRAKADRK